MEYNLTEIILNKDIEFKKMLIEGSEADINKLCDYLNGVNIDEFIDSKFLAKRAYESVDIPCFSNFNALEDMCKYLLFSKDSTYKEIGYYLKRCNKQTASVKYGENHAKLGMMFYLVNIENSKISKVNITNFGKYIVKSEFKNNFKALYILLLSNPFIQTIIFDLKKENINYKDYVKDLSVSTMIRRRGNTKFLVDNILSFSSSIKNTVNWEVK